VHEPFHDIRGQRGMMHRGEFDEMKLTSTILHVKIKKAAPFGAAFQISFHEDQAFLRRFAAARPPSPANNIQPAAGSGTGLIGVPAR
jgi:hypothetical protein